MHFVYIMDPMCAWCYGFQPELESFLAKYPIAEVDWIMGGLAPDTNQPMDDALKETIASYWHQIEQRSNVKFNHDYWKLNTPYRSTYPACRAVISAESLAKGSAHKMVAAIQSAYYLEAKNPSLEEILIECAASIGLDKQRFIEKHRSTETENRLQQHLGITRQFQVNGFPALFYVNEERVAYPLALGFCKTQDLEDRLNKVR